MIERVEKVGEFFYLFIYLFLYIYKDKEGSLSYI